MCKTDELQFKNFNAIIFNNRNTLCKTYEL